MTRSAAEHDDAESSGGGHKPGLRSFLQLFQLDVTYESAAGNWLTRTDKHGESVRVLDLVGGYGSLLLGHQHPELIAVATQFLTAGGPIHVQGSRRRGAEQIADAIARRLGRDVCCVLANSGAEAVEAAIKHALLETGGGKLIALEKGFHGKTLGALQLTANPKLREAFGCAGVDVIRVQSGDTDRLREIFRSKHELAGFIFEPIQGEGGVRAVDVDFLLAAQQLCRQYNVPLIADECQTGLGRTGAFSASQALGLEPDYWIFAKGLGGGIAKISALAIERSRYQERFDLLHSSTFADDEFSCAIASRTLQLLDATTIQAGLHQGERLLDELSTLKREFPDVIRDVRGTGLLLGVELAEPPVCTSRWATLLAERELYGYLISSYLLHLHQIRIAPTLSAPNTLRIQPSLLVSAEEIDLLVSALRELCERLQRRDYASLTEHMLTAPPMDRLLSWALPRPMELQPLTPDSFWDRERTARTNPMPKVAWIFHFGDERDLNYFDDSFSRFSMEQSKQLLDWMATLASPLVLDGVEIQSRTGQSVQFYPILLPVTSAWMLEQRKRGWQSPGLELVQQAVEVADRIGCSVATLGQYTSIISGGGRWLRRGKLGIRTGNHYTVALIEQAIVRVLTTHGLDSKEFTLGIVGASGDIGGSCAQLLAPRFRRCLLWGSERPSARRRLERMAQTQPGCVAATNREELQSADVVIVAVSDVASPYRYEDFKDTAMLCDVSYPGAFLTKDGTSRGPLPLQTELDVAVQLHGNEDVMIPGLPLPRGHVYGCMAESMLLGLAGIDAGELVAVSSPELIEKFTELGEQHGFQLADKIRPHVHTGVK